jgi:hypothetical protein
LENDEVQGE